MFGATDAAILSTMFSGPNDFGLLPKLEGKASPPKGEHAGVAARSTKRARVVKKTSRDRERRALLNDKLGELAEEMRISRRADKCAILDEALRSIRASRRSPSLAAVEP